VKGAIAHRRRSLISTIALLGYASTGLDALTYLIDRCQPDSEVLLVVAPQPEWSSLPPAPYATMSQNTVRQKPNTHLFGQQRTSFYAAGILASRIVVQCHDRTYKA